MVSESATEVQKNPHATTQKRLPGPRPSAESATDPVRIKLRMRSRAQYHAHKAQILAGKKAKRAEKRQNNGTLTKEGLRQDLVGKPFGRLRVEAMLRKDGQTYAACRCKCGKTKMVIPSNLRHEKTTSCGCVSIELQSKKKRKDLTGQRFGCWVVQEMQWVFQGKTRALCLCDCGTIRSVAASKLLTGGPSSCGCTRPCPTPEERYARRKLRIHARRMRELGLPATFSRASEVFMLEYWADRCAICGKSADFWHVIAWDHWKPLSAHDCPGTVAENILPLYHARKGARTLGGQPACNNTKSRKDPVQWLIAHLGPRKAKAKLRQIEQYFVEALAYAQQAPEHTIGRPRAYRTKGRQDESQMVG